MKDQIHRRAAQLAKIGSIIGEEKRHTPRLAGKSREEYVALMNIAALEVGAAGAADQ